MNNTTRLELNLLTSYKVEYGAQSAASLRCTRHISLSNVILHLNVFFRVLMVNLESRESRENLDRRVTPVPLDPKDHPVPLDLLYVSL